MLSEALEAAGRCSGGAIFIVGESGVGKTRLANEVARLAERAGQPSLRGRAIEATLPYRPLSEALLAAFRHRAPPADPALLAYRPALSRLVPEWREGGTPATEDPILLAEALLRLLAVLGRRQGCLVVLEDLQYCDGLTLSVIEYLCDNLGSEPVLLVATVGAQLGEPLTVVRSIARRRAAIVVELDGLDDREVGRLVASRLGVAAADVPAAVLTRLRHDAGGVPRYVEELLDGMVRDGTVERAGGGLRVRGPLRPGVPGVPGPVVDSVGAIAARLGPATRAVLEAAAMQGERFHLAVVAAVTGLERAELIGSVRAAVVARLVVGDGDMCAFRHAIVPRALRAGLLPIERADLAGRVADAIEEAFPGLPDQWCALAAELRLAAGDRARAARLLHEAGRRAANQGGIASAIRLLDRGLDVLAEAGTSGQSGVSGDKSPATDLATDLAETLLDALIAAGALGRAVALAAQAAGSAPGHRRAAVHLRLARAHGLAGRWDAGMGEVQRARGLLAGRTDAETAARVDVVAAQLALDGPAADRVQTAQLLAGRALRTALTAVRPEIACEALEVLGTCARWRNPAEAESFFHRGLEIAQEHRLGAWQVRLLGQLGDPDGHRSGSLASLLFARETAFDGGAMVAGLTLDAKLGMLRLIGGAYADAERAARRCHDAGGRLHLPQIQLTGLGLRGCIAAHRHRRGELSTLLTRFRADGGDESDFAVALWGLGLAFSALLDEDREQASAELRRAATVAAARPSRYWSLVCGPHLLLAALAGDAGWVEFHAVAAALRRSAWSRRFGLLTRAVLRGREGHDELARQDVREFLAIQTPQPLAYHLGLRLVAQAALDDGWGDPAPWLREAEAYFHGLPARPIAAACRALLRRVGTRVPQRRQGTAAIPLRLRKVGVTAREYEVLELVGASLGNREIARSLFLSLRTVEKHVANLLAKTGETDRLGLARHAVGPHTLSS